MSANKSNLSNSRYGYDFVVATTQKSINATMQEYLYFGKFPTVKMYWIVDKKGLPEFISHNALMALTDNLDPLTVLSWDGSLPMPTAIETLKAVRFYFGFEATIGIPLGIEPSEIPDIIKLLSSDKSVIFSLICSQFTVVTCNLGYEGIASFVNSQQPVDAPWLFTSTVPLKEITDNSNLPPAVQAELDRLGPNAFSVQQLLFDLDNASLKGVPIISGIPPGSPAYDQLMKVFLNAYFAEMKISGQPVLNYSITPNSAADYELSTLTLTSLELGISPYIPESSLTNDLNTLNYLCETNGDKRLPPAAFLWNWVEPSEVSSFDGVVSINRNTFAEYFQGQLTPLVSRNCFKPKVKVSKEGRRGAVIAPPRMIPGQAPRITRPGTGETVLEYFHEGFDRSEVKLGVFDLDDISMEIRTEYTASVRFTGSTIVISQHLLIRIRVEGGAGSHEAWNSTDTRITDTYTLAAHSGGKLTASHTGSERDDKSQEPKEDSWFVDLFTDFNELLAATVRWAEAFLPTGLRSIPVSVAQEFVFPGGKTFAYKDVVFSEHQDLISHITYVQPSS